MGLRQKAGANLLALGRLWAQDLDCTFDLKHLAKTPVYRRHAALAEHRVEGVPARRKWSGCRGQGYLVLVVRISIPKESPHEQPLPSVVVIILKHATKFVSRMVL